MNTVEELKTEIVSRKFLVAYLTKEGWPQEFIDSLVRQSVKRELDIFLSLFLPKSEV